MENRPPADRGLLIPILIGMISIIGIGLLFSLEYLNRSRVPAPPEPTATPFIYLLLATETSTLNPELEALPSEEIFSEEFFPTDSSFLDLGTVQPSTIGTPTDIPTIGEALSLVAGKYDDTDISIEYFGDWTETNNGTAYQGTLHVSNAIGNDMAFSFEGQQLQLGYQSVLGLGILVITIDDEQFVLAQTSGDNWISPQLPSGLHFVIIIHESGDSINVDYINIIDES